MGLRRGGGGGGLRDSRCSRCHAWVPGIAASRNPVASAVVLAVLIELGAFVLRRHGVALFPPGGRSSSRSPLAWLALATMAHGVLALRNRTNAGPDGRLPGAGLGRRGADRVAGRPPRCVRRRGPVRVRSRSGDGGASWSWSPRCTTPPVRRPSIASVVWAVAPPLLAGLMLLGRVGGLVGAGLCRLSRRALDPRGVGLDPGRAARRHGRHRPPHGGGTRRLPRGWGLGRWQQLVAEGGAAGERPILAVRTAVTLAITLLLCIGVGARPLIAFERGLWTARERSEAVQLRMCQSLGARSLLRPVFYDELLVDRAPIRSRPSGPGPMPKQGPKQRPKHRCAHDCTCARTRPAPGPRVRRARLSRADDRAGRERTGTFGDGDLREGHTQLPAAARAGRAPARGPGSPGRCSGTRISMRGDACSME